MKGVYFTIAVLVSGSITVGIAHGAIRLARHLFHLEIFHRSSNWGGMCGAVLMAALIVLILVMDRYERQIIAFGVLVIDRLTALHPRKDDHFDTY